MAVGAARGGGLDEAGGKVARLGEEEEADLGDVGARRDVDEVVLFLGVEGGGAREVVERAVDLLEVPGVGDVDRVDPDLRLGRDVADVLHDRLHRWPMGRLADQLEAADQEVVVLEERDRGAPPLPPLPADPRVEGRAVESQDHDRLRQWDKTLSNGIVKCKDREASPSGRAWHAICSSRERRVKGRSGALPSGWASRASRLRALSRFDSCSMNGTSRCFRLPAVRLTHRRRDPEGARPCLALPSGRRGSRESPVLLATETQSHGDVPSRKIFRERVFSVTLCLCGQSVWR